MYRNFKLFSVFALVALLLSIGSGVVVAQESSSEPLLPNEIVFTIPVGTDSGEINYAGVHEEMLPWGVTSFAVDESGKFHILDGVENHIYYYDEQGTLLSTIELSNEIIGATDIEVIGDNLFVLDVANVRPMVHHLDSNGTIIISYPIPEYIQEKQQPGKQKLVWGTISGIHVKSPDNIYVHNGIVTLRVADTEATVPAYKNFQDNEGRIYKISPPNWSENPHKGEIQLVERSGNIKEIDVSVTHALGGIRYLGDASEGEFFIVVEEVFYDGTIHVDQTVRQYDSAGELLGIARIPLNKFYTPVENGIIIGPDDNVYALVPRSDEIEVQKLKFTNDLRTIFPIRLSSHSIQGSKTFYQSFLANNSTLSCRSRSTMQVVVDSYINNYTYLNSTNINGSCSCRVRPRYLEGIGAYPSVSYDAGGWDTPRQFNNAMYAGKQAGDIDFGCTASCSRGTDCSGFVSRVWGRASKLYTWTIPNYSTSISLNDLEFGDVLNKPYDHVMIFEEYCGNGVMVYESTAYDSYDRVIRTYHPWSYIDDYTPRRYNNVCP
jgi:hypothetical protein